MVSRRLGLAALLCATTGCAQCPDPFAAPGSPITALHFPTGLALHPTRPVLFVASSNYDKSYGSGVVMAANLSWLHAQLALHDKLADPVADPWQGVARVPSIGRTLQITPDGATLFHLTAEDNRLVQLDVTTTDEGVTLGCGQSDSTDATIRSCLDGDHVLTLPEVDPYGLAVRRDGDIWRAYVGSLRNGSITAIDFHPHLSGPGRLSVAWDKNMGDSFRGGTLAWLPSVAGQPFYLFSSGRDVPGDGSQLGFVHYFSPDLGDYSAPVDSIDLREQAASIDIRGLTFSADGLRGYLVSKSPGGVVELDVSRRPDGRPLNRVTRVAPLGKEPSVLALYEPAAGRSPDAPPPPASLLLATSQRDGILFALDVDTFQLVGALRDIGRLPYDIVVDRERALAYVSCFNDDTVAVVGLPRHAGDMRFAVVARLGTPRDDTPTNPEVPSVFPVLPSLPGGG